MRRILSFLLAAMLLLSCAALAEDTTTLTVRGTGVVSVTADVACVVLGVREMAADVREAQATVNEKINAIYDALIEAGVEPKDIGTESIYIYASYDYSNGEERLVGYNASNNISVTTQQIDRMGEFIDVAFAAGANSLDSVNFSSLDNADAQKEALELAVQGAFEKAEVIAAAAGMKILRVKSFDETQDRYTVDTGAKYSNVRTEGAALDRSTMVQASSLQIEASVLVEFELCEG